jgi:hypothetical protein
MSDGVQFDGEEDAYRYAPSASTSGSTGKGPLAWVKSLGLAKTDKGATGVLLGIVGFAVVVTLYMVYQSHGSKGGEHPQPVGQIRTGIR